MKIGERSMNSIKIIVKTGSLEQQVEVTDIEYQSEKIEIIREVLEPYQKRKLVPVSNSGIKISTGIDCSGSSWRPFFKIGEQQFNLSYCQNKSEANMRREQLKEALKKIS